MLTQAMYEEVVSEGRDQTADLALDVFRELARADEVITEETARRARRYALILTGEYGE